MSPKIQDLQCNALIEKWDIGGSMLHKALNLVYLSHHSTKAPDILWEIDNSLALDALILGEI